MCVRKLCVWTSCVCVSRREEAELCVSKLCVSKLCVRKLCVDKLCVSRWEEAEGEAEEEGGSAGVPNQKQEPHTKMWGKTYIQIKTYNDLYIYISKELWIWDNGGINQQNYGDHWGVKLFLKKWGNQPY